MNNIETNIICLATLFVVLYKIKNAVQFGKVRNKGPLVETSVQLGIVWLVCPGRAGFVPELKQRFSEEYGLTLPHLKLIIGPTV